MARSPQTGDLVSSREALTCGFCNPATGPNHLARTVLWVSARAVYGVRERPDEDVGRILVVAWL
jgi:hypothetical protein